MGRCLHTKVKWYLVTIRYDDYSLEDHKLNIKTLKFRNKNVCVQSLESHNFQISLALSDFFCVFLIIKGFLQNIFINLLCRFAMRTTLYSRCC